MVKVSQDSPGKFFFQVNSKVKDIKEYNVLKENILNGAFLSFFKSINQNSSKDLNHTLGLTLSAPSLVSFRRPVSC